MHILFACRTLFALETGLKSIVAQILNATLIVILQGADKTHVEEPIAVRLPQNLISAKSKEKHALSQRIVNGTMQHHQIREVIKMISQMIK